MQVMSEHSFADTFERLESSIVSRGLTIFARINFSDDARQAGLEMKATRLLIFGNPKSGTPLMVASPSLALDLPLKVLVAEDESGRVSVSYDSPQYLKDRHGIPEELLKNISGVASIVDSVVK
jgi:uncharacterized protein (DUF302 family)